MKRAIMMLPLFVVTLVSLPQNFIPVDQNSTIKFKIKNLGITVSGSFTGLQGKIHFDPNNLPASSFEVSIDASTINTGIDMRNEHLRKEEYFDVKNHPRIQFVSTKVTPSSKAGMLFIFGKLTIKNVTKEISFPFTASPQDGGYLFNGEFKINRRDFKVGSGSVILGDNVTVMLNIHTRKA